MKLTERLAAVVGLNGRRDDDPPRYRAIGPGVVVTDTDAWAWYEIGHTNADLKGERGRDAEQDQAEAALRMLVGHECHLRVLWGQTSGAAYLAGLGLDEVPPLTQEWAAIRADNIDDLGLPSRRVLLGVKLATRARTSADGAAQALGLDTAGVPEGELARYSALALQLGGKLRTTLWRPRLASVELLAWSIAREQHRNPVLPVEDVVTGAPLARLVSGHVIPQPDHLVMTDAAGRPAAYTAVLALTDFPEVMATPGQEWLAVLNHLETSPLDATTDGGEPVRVTADASVRFTVPAAREARKVIGEARKSAKEQRVSAAKSSAGEPEDAILEAEAELRAIEFALARRHTLLVHDHPRVIVHGPSLEALEANVVAVSAAYDSMGIRASRCPDEQRELWLETLPCDRVRVPDLGHWRDATALVQSWFWGGARVGSNDPRVPAIGYTTGSTQQLARFLATESVSLSDAPVTVMLGRTRRGKTTAIQLCMLDVCLEPRTIERHPWAVLIDNKGDAGGVVDVAEAYGVASDLLQLGPEWSGVLDPFHTSADEHAIDHTTAQLQLLLPHLLAEQATSLIQRTAARIKHASAEPWAWQVVEAMLQVGRASTEGSLSREIAETLDAATSSGFGRLIAGRPLRADIGLPTRSGLTVIQLPGLNLPEADMPVSSWTTPHRSSVAALRGVLGWCTTVAGSPALRHRAKVVAVPEVHLLTATTDGRVFLTQTARMGAAFGLSLVLDTQDVSGIASLTGLAEGISAVFGFTQQTEAEQDALAKMLGLRVDDDTRKVIDDLDKLNPAADVGADSSNLRRGHCIYRDRAGNTATIQWVVPSDEVRRMLDTSPEASAARIARTSRPAEHAAGRSAGRSAGQDVDERDPARTAGAAGPTSSDEVPDQDREAIRA